MAQLTYAAQGQTATLGPLVASAMLLMSLVFALLGIKIWGFRRRLTFDRGGQSSTRSTHQQPQTAPRYAAYDSQVNGTDSAVHGVFRQRNIEEFESARPTNSAANKYLTGSVPNLPVATLAPYRYKDETAIPELSGSFPYRAEPQAARRRRREVHSANYDFYASPPTRQPPAPPIELDDNEPPSQLDMPNFDHFAEKYKLISAHPGSELVANKTQLKNKERGRYVKYEPVDDVPELLTPDDDQAGAAISVAAQVHQVPAANLTKTEPEPGPDATAESDPHPQLPCETKLLDLENTDSAFVVEIIAGTPDSIERTEPILVRNLFDNLETLSHVEDAEFDRIRSTYEMNEADLLDMQPTFAGLQTELPVPSSPPGFGKSIDDDWENFENLDSVTDVPQPNWSVHPDRVALPLSAQSQSNLDLENVVQREALFHQLELIAPADEQLSPQLSADFVEPPPYEMEPPALPILPDYESLMQQESSKTNQQLPKYADVVNQDAANGTEYVSSIEDLFVELQLTGAGPVGQSDTHAEEVYNFEELCAELEIDASPEPARRPPQPAPRVSKPTTLNVRRNAPPLTCYTPEELPSSSCSEADVEEIAAPRPPQPAKRAGRTLRVRFDVENLQYYESAEVPSSNESEVELESADEQDTQLPPRPTQRLITLLPDEHLSSDEPDVPRLFSTQVSQEDSDEESFGRIIRQHRSMTEALRITVQLDQIPNSERITEA